MSSKQKADTEYFRIGFKHLYLFFILLIGKSRDIDLESVRASRTANRMLAGLLRKTEHALASLATAVNVRFSVAYAQIHAIEGAEKSRKKAAERLVFPSSAKDIARKKPKERVPEEKKIQSGKHDPPDGMITEDAPKEDRNERKRKRKGIERIGTVASHKEERDPLAKAWTLVLHKKSFHF